MIPDEKGGHDSEIRMVLPGYGELLLQTYMYEPNPDSDLDREQNANWDYMAGRKIAVGWLKGATNLLLITWMDLSASHGTGHYVMQWYLLARMGAGSNAILLKKCVCSEGRERDISQSSGRGTHYFAYDPLKRELVDTMQFARAMYVGAGDNVPPLFYAAKGGDPEATGQYVADIQETVVHRYQLRAQGLKSLGVQMFYRTQPLDTPRNIARFYHGPLAQPTVILKANTDWKRRFGNDPGYESGWFRLPVGTLARIDLPEDWITKFYEEP